MTGKSKKRRWGLRLRGLRQRWVVNTVMPVCTLLLLIVALFSVGISNYYYGTMQKGLETQAQAMANSFNEYFMDNGYTSYYQKAVQSAETFEEKQYFWGQADGFYNVSIMIAKRTESK